MATYTTITNLYQTTKNGRKYTMRGARAQTDDANAGTLIYFKTTIMLRMVLKLMLLIILKLMTLMTLMKIITLNLVDIVDRS